MIQVALFLVSVGLLALGVVWFADRPGDVVINWLGMRIETSIFVAAVALVVTVMLAIVIWSIARGILRSPDQVSLFMRNRRAMKGYLAISRGLIAVGAGDARQAQIAAGEAARLSPEEPLALLLCAQAAQMSGDRADAERSFRAMAARPETKLIGLRGLYMEAQRAGDGNAARMFAEEAASTQPALAWAGQAALDFRCAAGDWAGALDALERLRGSRDKPAYRRERAVLLTARALAVADTQRDAALALALEAVKLAPALVPAAAFAARRLAEAGDLRKAARILERAWKASPHPELAEAYAHLRFGDSARDRLTRVQALAAKGPRSAEGALAIARAALDARDFAKARATLKPQLAAPTQRVATLMAEIEDTEHGDAGRARQWTARAVHAAPDPAWTADGIVSERWMPVSPASGRLDAFQWKVPLAEIGVERPLIEAEPDAPVIRASDTALLDTIEPAAIAPPPAAPKESPREAVPIAPPGNASAEVVALPVVIGSSAPNSAGETDMESESEAGSRQREPKEEGPSSSRDPKQRAAAKLPQMRAKAQSLADPVIPLLHAPDDPGPDTSADPRFETDPVPEPTSPLAEDPWLRLRKWLR